MNARLQLEPRMLHRIMLGSAGRLAVAPRSVIAASRRGLRVQAAEHSAPANKEKQQSGGDASLPESRADSSIQKRPDVNSVQRLSSNLSQVQKEVDSLLAAFTDPFFISRPFNTLSPFAAADQLLNSAHLSLDVEETENAYIINAAVPGFGKDQIKITLSPQHVLTLTGELEEKKKKNKSSVARFESFTRSVRLPQDIKADEVTATTEHGILTVKVPKAPAAERKTKEIPIA